MKDEEARRIVALEAFKVAEKKIQKLNVKLTEADQEKKSVKAALQGAKRQVEAKHKQLQQAEDELTTTNDHIKVLKKKIKEVKKARDQAEQDGYDIGVVETNEVLKAKVLEVCMNYYLQVWNEVLNQAKVEASSALRGAESVYYPPTIHASSSSKSKADIVFEEADIGKDSPAKALLSFDSPSK